MLSQFFRRKTPPKKLSPQRYIDQLLKSPYHTWLERDPILKRTVSSFFDQLPSEVIQKLQEDPLLFLKAQGRYGVAMAPPFKCHIILFFPEFVRFLKAADPSLGFAVLAHEIGHIVANHGGKFVDTLEAQVEADRFVLELGWGKELEEVLSFEDESLEKRVRVSYLTAGLLSV